MGDLEEATEDTVARDLPKLVTAMVVVSVDTEDMVDTDPKEAMVDTAQKEAMVDTAQKEAMVDTVARDLLMPATAMVVMEEDTEVSEEVMEVTMVDMDTEGKYFVQRPFDSS